MDSYLQLLSECPAELLDQMKSLSYPYTFTAAWKMLAEVLKDSSAATLLYCLAFFRSQQVPLRVFKYEHCPVNNGLAEILSSQISLSMAIRELTRHSLVRIDPQTMTIRVHRLIQAMARDGLAEDFKRDIEHDVNLILDASRKDADDSAAREIL